MVFLNLGKFMLIFIQCFMIYYFSRELVFCKWLVLFNENRAAYFYILCILEKYFSSQPRKKCERFSCLYLPCLDFVFWLVVGIEEFMLNFINASLISFKFCFNVSAKLQRGIYSVRDVNFKYV